MLAATTLDLYKNIDAFSQAQVGILLGAAASFVVAVLSMQFLIYFIKNYNFVGLWVYQIVLAFIFWLFDDAFLS